MKLYLSVIGISALIMAAFNIAFGIMPWYYVILAIIWCIALEFAIDGLAAIVINKMPDSWFSVDNPAYKVSDVEKRLYKKLRVRLWKDKVWELGGLGGFSKKNLVDPGNPRYVERFIIECNKGVLTHRLAYPLGFLVMLTVDERCALTIGLPVAIVNLFLNVLPTLALRYNTPKLQNLLVRLKRNQARKEREGIEEHKEAEDESVLSCDAE